MSGRTRRFLRRDRLPATLMIGALGVGAMLLFASAGGGRAAAGPSQLDFSIGIAMVDGNSNSCDSSGTPTSTCLVAAGEDFLVRVHLNRLPSDLSNGNYEGYDFWIDYSGVTADGTFASVDLTPWPDCVGPVASVASDHVAAACTVLVGPDSTYSGLMATVRLTCTADGQITLVNEFGKTDLADTDAQFYVDPDGTESLTINCVPPQHPADADGDGTVNSIDALLILQFGAGLLPSLPRPDNADANRDGAVNAIDAELALQIEAGPIPVPLTLP